jgi:hypothetical protein
MTMSVNSSSLMTSAAPGLGANVRATASNFSLARSSHPAGHEAALGSG